MRIELLFHIPNVACCTLHYILYIYGSFLRREVCQPQLTVFLLSFRWLKGSLNAPAYVPCYFFGSCNYMQDKHRAYGVPAEARTLDSQIKGLLLYQLSYRHILVVYIGFEPILLAFWVLLLCRWDTTPYGRAKGTRTLKTRILSPLSLPIWLPPHILIEQWVWIHYSIILFCLLCV